MDRHTPPDDTSIDDRAAATPRPETPIGMKLLPAFLALVPILAVATLLAIFLEWELGFDIFGLGFLLALLGSFCLTTILACCEVGK